MTDPLPPVSVVVPTYQRRGMVAEVVGALLADPAATEVIVVDDGCTDGTARLLDDMARGDRRLVPVHQANGGRQRARRAGIERATNEVVLLVDDDVRARPGLVGRHAAHHRAGGPLVVEGFMPVLLPAVRRAGQAATYLYATEYLSHCAQVQGDAAVLRQLWGGNVSLPRASALEVTAEADFPEAREDTHMGILCLRLGMVGRFDRSAAADHLHRRTPAQFVRDAEEQGAGRWWLHHLHADLLGGFDASEYLQELPPVSRPAVGRLSPALTIAARVAMGAAGQVRAFRQETAAARVVRRLALYRGAQRARVRAGEGLDRG